MKFRIKLSVIVYFFFVTCFRGFLTESWSKLIRSYVYVLFLGGAFGGKSIDIVPQTGIASVAAWK